MINRQDQAFSPESANRLTRCAYDKAIQHETNDIRSIHGVPPMRFIFFALFSMILSSSSFAATVVEFNARNSNFYQEFIGNGRTGTILNISTVDNWLTASFNIRVRTNITNGTDRSQIGMGLTQGSLDIKGGDFRADEYDGNTYALQYDLVNDQRVSLLSGAFSSTGETEIWDFLSTGRFGYFHSFFGNEFSHSASFFLSDRSIASYNFNLGDVANVPLPGSACLLFSALLFLFRRKSYGN